MIETADELIVGRTYKGTLTDCCIPVVQFQAKFMGHEAESGDLLFESDSTRILAYEWNLPRGLKEVTE